jgi:hypothetical protein
VGVRTADKSYFVLRIEDLEIVPSTAVVKEGDEVEISVKVSGKVEKDAKGRLTVLRPEPYNLMVTGDNLVSHTPAAVEPKPGTFGWATVGGVRRHGFIDSRGFIFHGREGSDHSFPGEFFDFEPESVPETALPDHTEEVLRRVVSNTLFVTGESLGPDKQDKLVAGGMKELRDGVPGPPLMAGTGPEKVDRGRLRWVLGGVLLNQTGNNVSSYPSDQTLNSVVDAVLEELGLE